MTGKILFVGGTGVVGEQMVRHFRDRHQDIPVLIGGRNIDKAAALARDVGLAEAIQVDTAQPRLGLGSDAEVGAVVMVVPDAGLQGLRYALDLGRPYLSIGNWLVKVGGGVGKWRMSFAAQAPRRWCCPAIGTPDPRSS